MVTMKEIVDVTCENYRKQHPEQLPGLHERREIIKLAICRMFYDTEISFSAEEIADAIIAADPATALLAECAEVLQEAKWFGRKARTTEVNQKIDNLLSRLGGVS